MELSTSEWISTMLAIIAIIISIFSWWTSRRNTLAAERNALAAEKSAEAAIESNNHLRTKMEHDREEEVMRFQAYRALYKKRLLGVETAKRENRTLTIVLHRDPAENV